MIKIYHSGNIDAINWKIFADYGKQAISYFPSGTKAIEVANKLCQYNLFDIDTSSKVYVVDIDGWKLTDAETKKCITELHSIDKLVIFAYESATVKNKLFTELKVEVVKATSVTKKSKAAMIHKLLTQAKIKLDPSLEESLVTLWPDNIGFIQNEVQKLKLFDSKELTKDELNKIIFELGDSTMFNIIDSWLNDNTNQTIERLNDLLSKGNTLQTIVPVFALKLIQIKFFLSAKVARWSPDIITLKQGIPYWQQNMYINLRPYDKKLSKINDILSKLYNFDINIKKQKNIPYTELIKILFD